MYKSGVLLLHEFILSKRQKLIIYIISIVACSLPLFLFDEKYIANSEELKNFSNYVSSFFPQINTYAEIASNYNLYHVVKFQYTWLFVVSIVIAMISLFIYAKIYLCSFGYIKSKSYCQFSMSQKIKTNQTSSSLIMLLLYILFLIFSLEIMFFGDMLNTLPPEENKVIRLFSTKIGAFIWSIFFSSGYGMALAYLTIEIIAQIRKILLNIIP